MPPTILDMVKLIGMMTPLAALYSAPHLLGTTPELRWYWIVVSVLLLCWSLLSLAVVVNTRRNFNDLTNCHVPVTKIDCFSKWLGLYHVFFICLHLAATMLLVSTGGLTTRTVDCTLVYPIAAMVVPVCVSILADLYIAYNTKVGRKLSTNERVSHTSRTLPYTKLWAATRFWIPGRANQWGSTKA
jgi:hypothetical protein